MNIPHEWHDDAAGDALLPPLLGTPYDAAGRIILALQGLGLTVQGLAITERGTVHVVIKPEELSSLLLNRIDRAMCQNPDVLGRWWSEDEASWSTLTRLGFEVG